MNDSEKKHFLHEFSQFAAGLSLRFSFKNLGYLPRWIVLLLDTFIVSFSGVVTYLLFKGVKLSYIQTANELPPFIAYIAFNVFFFWVFKTYSGIIRHSSYIDALKLFFAQSATLVVMVLINFVFLLAGEDKLFLNTGLFINAVLSFSFLFFYRVIVKQSFEKFFSGNDKKQLTRAIIYGSDANAIAVANALKSEVPGRFKLIGFIDKNNQNTTKRILDLPILNLNRKVPVLMRFVKAEALIIADKSLNKEERSIIVDDCLEFNLKVYTIPLVTDWDDQKEISKNIKSFEIHDLLERKPIVLDTKSISNQLDGKTILITGAAGSIGSEIVRQVLEFNPKKIIMLDQAETPLHSLSLEILSKEKDVALRNVIADIRNLDSLEKVFKTFQPQVVYHAAAYKHVPLMEENPSQAIFTNVMGTKNLADLSKQFNVEHFVMISTDKAVNPSSVMGASKRIAEMYVQSLHFKNAGNRSSRQTKFITTRFGNVLGSNGSVVPLFTKQIQEGGPITITHPEIIRYFMTIPEACQLVLEAGAMGNGGEIFIFDMGKPVKIIDLAKKMIRLAGFTPDKDIAIKIVGLRPGEKLYEELLNNSAKNLPTHHEKIMIAEEICTAFHQLTDEVEDLIILSHLKSNATIVAKMKKIVPEFKSMNSVFQELDS
ncbi:polysaccharide biosynthesis protein [Flavobacterium lacus]|uniref:FlaA1/EpsC-like NDP-sugar epimerase n=1 Tax=Flavobacterium lacus TaxID=1353778 RepID=A0A328X3K2_9FLAO|nr:nucleoside-diphosphate sugar epimerase/dehydratase [Flavobacterium lacus]RAR51127.1 FlaA1/EpsC-like NDP-sugar epimerase [Flavobacterium lacus]